MAMNWQETADAVRAYLRERFDQPFSRGTAPLLRKGKADEHTFEAVSQDGRIVGDVKRLTRPDDPDEMKHAALSIAYLHFADADHKLLFLLDPLFYMAFCRKHEAEIVQWRRDGIEVVSPFELGSYLAE